MGCLGNTRVGLEAPDGMVVFGFGRYQRATPLMAPAGNRFRVRFLEREIRSTEDHQALGTALE